MRHRSSGTRVPRANGHCARREKPYKSSSPAVAVRGILLPMFVVMAAAVHVGLVEARGDEEPGTAFPVIESLSLSEQVGEICVFGGQVSGSAINGGVVVFSGVLDGFSASINVDGSYSVSGNFPAGVQGVGYAVAYDTLGNSSELVSLSIDVAPVTPEEPPADDGSGDGGSGEETGNGEDSGEDGGDAEYGWPTIDYLDQADLGGGYFLFSGHASGEATIGATVQFHGLLEGLGAAVDYDGNFYVVQYFVDAPIGYAEAELIDLNGFSSGPVSLLVSFPGDGSSEGGGDEQNPPEDLEGDQSGEEGGGENGDGCDPPNEEGSDGEPEGGDAGDGEGDGSGSEATEDPPEDEPYVSPSVAFFHQADQSGDWFVFEGSLSGSDVAGATVVFSGILDGLSTVADGSGSFSIAVYLPQGAVGVGYAQAVDTTGVSSGLTSLYIDIPGSSE